MNIQKKKKWKKNITCLFVFDSLSMIFLFIVQDNIIKHLEAWKSKSNENSSTIECSVTCYTAWFLKPAWRKCDSLPVAGMLYHMATSAVEILLSAAGLHSPVIGGVVGSPWALKFKPYAIKQSIDLLPIQHFITNWGWNFINGYIY